MAMKTPTVPAMPSTATMAEVQRALHAAHIIDDRDRHGQTLRSALTTRMRMAPMPGSRPLMTPTISAVARPTERIAGERIRVGSSPLSAAPKTGIASAARAQAEKTADQGDGERFGEHEEENSRGR